MIGICSCGHAEALHNEDAEPDTCHGDNDTCQCRGFTLAPPTSDAPIQQARAHLMCPHPQRSRSGGNDYIECGECGFIWDYRKVADPQPHAIDAYTLAVQQSHASPVSLSVEAAINKLQCSAYGHVPREFIDTIIAAVTAEQESSHASQIHVLQKEFVSELKAIEDAVMPQLTELKAALDAERKEHAAQILTLEQSRRWLPMETAPKDGTYIDLWAKSWLPAFDRFESRRFADCCWMNGDTMCNRPPYWLNLDKEWFPMYWTPLPTSPEAQR